MKRLLLIGLLLSFGFSQSKVNINNLVAYGGKMFKQDDDKPYTGRVFDLDKSTGTKVMEGRYEDGLKDGLWIEWYSNGQKEWERTYKDGKLDGLQIGWSKDGTLQFKRNYKDGRKYGRSTEYYKDDEYIRSGVSKNKIGDNHTITEYEDDKIHGRFLKFHEGQLVIEENYKQNELDGKSAWYYNNGQKKEERTYKNGKEDGLYTHWYENGQKREEATYKDSKYDGLFTEWYENGQKKEEGNFNDGVGDGLWTTWYENGQKESEGTFKDGVLVRYYTFYEKDGSIKEPINYETTLIEKDYVYYTKDTNQPYSGQVFSLYENGQKKEEGIIKDGEEDGLWTYWNENGERDKKKTLINGEIIDEWTYHYQYFDNGKKKDEKTYKDGKEDGKWTEWYSDGKKQYEGTYKEGRKNGIWTYWYENGEKIFEGTYINGKENGLWHWWYNNGKKRLQGSFSNGEKTGEWIFFSTNDEPMSYNQEFSTKIYSSDGRMLDKLFNESKDLNPINSRNDEKNNHNIQGFVEYVRNSLRNKDLNIYRYGYNIHTSLDFRLQQIANESMMESVIINQKKMVSENNDSKNISLIQSAFIALDPITGGILAMIGGRSDYQDKLNRAVQSKRQPGSVFNLFVYTTALDNGYPVTTQLLNQPVVLNVRNADGELVKWMPKNYDGSTGGLTTFREGIRKSLNLIPVRMVQQDIAPAEQVKQMAKRLGINTDIWVGDAIALGTSEVYPLEIVSAYSALANKGVYSKPFAITKIEDRYGNVIKEYFPNRKEVMNEENAYLMTSLMQTVMDRGTGGSARWKYNFKRPAAGKTGTTQLWTDAWFIGFTPQIAAGCWFGIDDFRDSLGPGQDGSKVALPAWARFMKVAHDTLDLEIKKFEKPAGIIDKEICSVTKKVPLSACPVEVEIFKSRTEPTQKCKVHR